MSFVSLPPGFRFHPTDDELVGYYLKRKEDGLEIELEVIPVIDLYKFDPWELPDKSFLPKRDKEWFFFCPRDRKYPNSSRTNRATGSGYWKATGKDRKVFCESSVHGLRKTLVFYCGRAPGGERTDWVMHEYRLCEDLSQGSPNFVGAFALCRIVKRRDHGQKKRGDLQGESKARDGHASAMTDFSSNKSSTTITSSPEDGRGAELHQIMNDSDQINFWELLVSDASKVSSPKKGLSESIITNVFPSSVETCIPCNLSLITPFASFREEAYVIDGVHCHGFSSSFPSSANCMDMCSNVEDITLQSFEWVTPKMNASFSGIETWNPELSPSICSQESEEEEVNLWLQEDSMVIVK